MNNGKTYYDMLDLPKMGKYLEGRYAGYSISREGLKNAEERVKGNFGWGSREAKEAEFAYNFLSDTERRRQYDEYLENSYNKGISFEEYLKGTQEEKTAGTGSGTGGTGTEGTGSGTEGTPEEEKEEEKTAGTGSGTGGTGTEGTGSGTEGTPEETKEEEKTAGTGSGTGGTGAEETGSGTEGTPEEEKEEEKTTETGVGTGTEETPEETKEEPKKEEEKQNGNSIPIEEINPGFFARMAKKVWSKANGSNGFKMAVAGTGIIVVGGLTVGLPGLAIAIPLALATGKLINSAKKFKLRRDNKTKKVTEFQTEETKLFEEYNEKLEKSIDELLSKPNKNYELNIAILKYRNQVELLEKRIQNKKTQQVKKGGMLRYKIELGALEKQLEKARKTLALLEEKVKGKDKSTRLTKLNEELYEKRDEKEAAEDAMEDKLKNGEKVDRKEKISVKNLEVDFNALKRKRDKNATKMAIHKEGIAKKQAFLVAFDVAKKKVSNFFGNMSGIEPEEEKGGKTR